MRKDYYVYGWFNNDWNAYFYIGSGRGLRYKDTHKRSKMFEAVVKNWDCEPLILSEGLSEIEAEIQERRIKRRLLFEAGHPLLDAEPESLKREAQRVGIERAKAEGKYKGRKPVEVDKYEFASLYSEVERGERTNKYVMDKLGLKRNTYYKLVDEFKNKTGRFEE